MKWKFSKFRRIVFAEVTKNELSIFMNGSLLSLVQYEDICETLGYNDGD
jgi:hypothetical protein